MNHLKKTLLKIQELILTDKQEANMKGNVPENKICNMICSINIIKSAVDNLSFLYLLGYTVKTVALQNA